MDSRKRLANNSKSSSNYQSINTTLDNETERFETLQPVNRWNSSSLYRTLKNPVRRANIVYTLNFALFVLITLGKSRDLRSFYSESPQGAGTDAMIATGAIHSGLETWAYYLAWTIVLHKVIEAWQNGDKETHAESIERIDRNLARLVDNKKGQANDVRLTMNNESKFDLREMASLVGEELTERLKRLENKVDATNNSVKIDDLTQDMTGVKQSLATLKNDLNSVKNDTITMVKKAETGSMFFQHNMRNRKTNGDFNNTQDTQTAKLYEVEKIVHLVANKNLVEQVRNLYVKYHSDNVPQIPSQEMQPNFWDVSVVVMGVLLLTGCGSEKISTENVEIVLNMFISLGKQVYSASSKANINTLKDLLENSPIELNANTPISENTAAVLKYLLAELIPTTPNNQLRIG